MFWQRTDLVGVTSQMLESKFSRGCLESIADFAEYFCRRFRQCLRHGLVE